MESNKTEVLCFGKHWDKYCILSNCEEYEARFHFQSGQQSKQDEIDELQKNFNNALKTIDIQQQFLDDTDGTIKIITSQVDELQNRIDDLKSFCIKGVESNMLSIEYNQALIDMHNILKGNANDH